MLINGLHSRYINKIEKLGNDYCFSTDNGNKLLLSLYENKLDHEHPYVISTKTTVDIEPKQLLNPFKIYDIFSSKILLKNEVAENTHKATIFISYTNKDNTRKITIKKDYILICTEHELSQIDFHFVDIA